jgi:hypothetical protein
MRPYASFDPVQDHYSYVNELGRQQGIREMIADEMYNLRCDALERISTIVHPEYEAEFIKLLTVALSDGIAEAEILTKKLGLNQEHLIALRGDESEMRDHLNKSKWDLEPDHDHEIDRYLDMYV